MGFVRLLTYLPSPGWSQDCGHPGAPKYAEEVAYADTYQLGDRIQYNCSLGYELFSITREKVTVTGRYCLPSGTWSNEQHLCYRKRVLEDKTSPSNCYFYSQADSNGWYGFKEDLRFDTSVKLVKVKLQNPVMLSLWLVHEKNCYRQKWDAHSQLPSTDFVFRRPAVKKRLDSTCAAKEFALYSKEEFRLCYLAAYEIPDSCGDPETPANGQLALFQNRTVAYYACNPGYRLQGNKYRHCRQGFWTGTQAVCEQLADENMLRPYGHLQIPSDILSTMALGLAAFTLLALLLTVGVIMCALRQERDRLTTQYSVLFTKRNHENNGSSKLILQSTYDDCNIQRTCNDSNKGIYEEIPDFHRPNFYANQPVNSHKLVDLY